MNTEITNTSQTEDSPVPAGNSPVTLDGLHATFEQWLYTPPEDREMLDVTLATYKSHELPGDPLWTLIIDGSGGGKTEQLRPLESRPESYFLSKLSPKCLSSGYRDPKNPDKDPSLLPELDGKVLIIKDLSPILAMRPDDRREIFGQFRDAYDGFTDEAKGNLGRVQYRVHFSFLAGTTLAVDRHDEVERELGERFIRCRARSNDTHSKVQAAFKNTGREEEMRAELEHAVSAFLDSLPKLTVDSLSLVPTYMQEWLCEVADFTARARSAVARDRQHNALYLPRPEVGSRLVKELGKLLVSLAAIRGHSEPNLEDFGTIMRVAEDCLPPNRFAIINALKVSRGVPLSVKDICGATGLSRSTVAYALEDLKLLGVIKSVTSEKAALSVDPTLWQLN